LAGGRRGNKVDRGNDLPGCFRLGRAVLVTPLFRAVFSIVVEEKGGANPQKNRTNPL
jgi:hypothetical protein